MKRLAVLVVVLLLAASPVRAQPSPELMHFAERMTESTLHTDLVALGEDVTNPELRRWVRATIDADQAAMERMDPDTCWLSAFLAMWDVRQMVELAMDLFDAGEYEAAAAVLDASNERQLEFDVNVLYICAGRTPP